MGWVELKSNRPGRNSVSTLGPRQVRLSRQVNNANRPGKPKSLAIRIGDELAREYRLLIGDRVKVFIDHEAKLCLLKRVTGAGGYKYAWYGTDKTKRMKMEGKHATGIIKANRPDEELDFIFSNGKDAYSVDAVLTDEGIVFEIPSASSHDEVTLSDER